MTYAATATQTAAQAATQAVTAVRRMFTKQERSEWARQGAEACHQRHDPRDTTVKARESFLNRFYFQVDPHWQLLPHDRAVRVEAAKRAYFTQLAMARWQKQHRHEPPKSSQGDGRYACTACCKEADVSFPAGHGARICGWHKLMLKLAVCNDVAAHGVAEALQESA